MVTVCRQVSIYGLCDPVNGALRYVGRTVSGIEQRLRAHLCAARRGDRRHISCWLRDLLRRGQRPEVFLLEAILPGGDWEEAERFWIAYLRGVGCALTNVADGGGGSLGFKMSAQSRAKMSASRTGRIVPEEVRQRARERNRGIRPSDQAFRLAREAVSGKPLSDGHKRRISEALSGRKMAADFGTAISDRLRGQPAPEGRTEASAAGLVRATARRGGGVCLRGNGSWRAYISVGKRQRDLGYFKTKEAAVAARRAAEVEYWGVAA